MINGEGKDLFAICVIFNVKLSPSSVKRKSSCQHLAGCQINIQLVENYQVSQHKMFFFVNNLQYINVNLIIFKIIYLCSGLSLMSTSLHTLETNRPPLVVVVNDVLGLSLSFPFLSVLSFMI
jgi:hypothetical protein